MINSAFGLDIGTTTLKSVWLDWKKQTAAIKSAYSSSSPVAGMVSASPIDEEQMANAIKNHVTEAKIGTRDVHVALPDNQVYTKVIELPMLSEKELSSAIYWEAEQYIPAPLSTIILDHIVLRKNIQSNVGPRMQVLLVGAPKKTLEKYERVLDLARLNVVSIETEMLASVRAIVTSSSFPVSLIVSIGSLNTSIAIVQNGIIVFTYTIPLGSASITKAIASDFGISQEQAEEYKKAYGITEQNVGVQIHKAIEPILLAIIAEIKKAIAYYNERYANDDPLTQIVLSGGTAKLPGIDVFFVKQLSLETVIANPLKTGLFEAVPASLIESGPEFTVAIGLAMKSYES